MYTFQSSNHIVNSADTCTTYGDFHFFTNVYAISRDLTVIGMGYDLRGTRSLQWARPSQLRGSLMIHVVLRELVLTGEFTTAAVPSCTVVDRGLLRFFSSSSQLIAVVWDSPSYVVQQYFALSSASVQAFLHLQDSEAMCTCARTAVRLSRTLIYIGFSASSAEMSPRSQEKKNVESSPLTR